MYGYLSELDISVGISLGLELETSNLVILQR
jgi:hypothetical protein